MGKLRGRTQNNKIAKPANTSALCSSEQYPWFSFQSVTTNRHFNLSNLCHGTEKEVTYELLHKRFVELSSKTWTYWMQQPKKTGLETINYGSLNFKAPEEASLSSDTTIYVFRFDTAVGEGKGRIIGYKKSPCSVLHIIGYDLDFSAYNHG